MKKFWVFFCLISSLFAHDIFVALQKLPLDEETQNKITPPLKAFHSQKQNYHKQTDSLRKQIISNSAQGKAIDFSQYFKDSQKIADDYIQAEMALYQALIQILPQEKLQALLDILEQ
ncbi:MAG: hypothetical protein J1E31_04830 [Helicobacter sp.]|nr:hypothetical protein [Helicobacter sp.]